MAIEGSRELAAALAAIKKGNPRALYLVFGNEPYLVRTASDAIVEALASSGAEIERVDASGRPAAAILEPVTALSLFASAKVTVVRNFAHLMSGQGADTILAGVDVGLGPGSALVFVASGSAPGDKIDKRVKGYKGLVKRGVVVELNRQKPDALADWLRQKASEEQKELTADGAALLLDRVGTDMEALRLELDKAILYCLDQKRIGAKDLESLVGKTREDAVWDVTEAVAKRDAAKALELVDDLVASGTYPLVLLTLLVRQARHLLQARLLWEKAGRPAFRDIRSFQSRAAPVLGTGAFGKGPDDVTTIHPFASFKRFEAARGHETDELRRVLVRLRRTDRDIKTGRAAGAREALEELVLDLCAMPAETPAGRPAA